MKGTNWRRENKRAKIPRESITSVGLACFCPIYRVRSRASPSAIALTATATAAAAGCPLLPFCPLLAISASSRRRRRPPSFLAPFRPAAKGASRRSLFAYPRLPADIILILLLGLHCSVLRISVRGPLPPPPVELEAGTGSNRSGAFGRMLDAPRSAGLWWCRSPVENLSLRHTM
jgi:hypothetical protein